MFSKLRLKLTLINATVIFILFVILISGTYYFSYGQITHRSETLANKIMTDIKSGIINNMPPRRNNENHPPGPHFFFVKTSQTGAIIFQSSDTSLESDSLETIVKETLERDVSKGVVLLGQSEFSYFISPNPNEHGDIILFQDLTNENNMLRIQLTALLVAGIVCLILSFFGSYLMANRAMIPIQKAWLQQTEFLSDASHELRTPLAVIQTNLDIVLNNPNVTVESQHKWLLNIREESAQMAKLVDALLFLARADANQQYIQNRTFSLNAVLMQAVAPFEPVAERKGLSIQLSVKNNYTGYGDESRIKQVLSILIDNAIRHTPSGGKVSVQLTNDNDKTILTVSDTGEGIEPQYLDKIFDRFYQVDKSRSNGGAGLGLAIAKCIIESHSGIIDVDSTPGFGTTFTIQFPSQFQVNRESDRRFTSTETYSCHNQSD